jgi:outer membrane protein insertion porin family
MTTGTAMDNVGGNIYWATTAELQSNIPGVPKEYSLRASVFVDAGLTWASPFGALTVNYAVPLSKAAYDVVQPLSFTAGGF